jgi:hypothetical protein
MIALGTTLIDGNGEARPPAEPAPGPRTQAQSINRWIGGGMGGLVGGLYGSNYVGDAIAFGGCIGRLNLFPDGIYFAGSYPNYRLMRKNPIIALAESIVLGPLDGGAWMYKKRDESAPDAWVKMVEDNFERLRPDVVAECSEGVPLGCQPFEIVWKFREGMYAIDYLKGLDQEYTSIVVDKSGRLAGITQGGIDTALDLNKSFVYTHLLRRGKYHGEPRLENVRDTAWASWMHTMGEMRKLRTKLAGIIPIGYVPPGGPDPANPSDTYMLRMQSLLPMLAKGMGVVFEHLGFSIDDVAARPELLKESLTKIDFYDAGNVAAAQGGMIEDLTHSEMLLFAGMLRSARTGLESQHGSRADATQHTDTGIADSERIDREIARQLSAGPVNALLTLNFGEKARDAVYITPVPLIDRKREVLQALVEQIIALPGIGEEVLNKVIDVDKAIDGLEIERKGDYQPVNILPPVPPIRGQMPFDPNPNPNDPGNDPNAQ